MSPVQNLVRAFEIQDTPDPNDPHKYEDDIDRLVEVMGEIDETNTFVEACQQRPDLVRRVLLKCGHCEEEGELTMIIEGIITDKANVLALAEHVDLNFPCATEKEGGATWELLREIKLRHNAPDQKHVASAGDIDTLFMYADAWPEMPQDGSPSLGDVLVQRLVPDAYEAAGGDRSNLGLDDDNFDAAVWRNVVLPEQALDRLLSRSDTHWEYDRDGPFDFTHMRHEHRLFEFLIKHAAWPHDAMTMILRGLLPATGANISDTEMGRDRLRNGAHVFQTMLTATDREWLSADGGSQLSPT